MPFKFNPLTGKLDLVNAAAAGGGGGDFSDGGEAGGADRTLGNTDNYDLGFLTNNSNRLHIQNDGIVGIGTISPNANALLDVAGPISQSGLGGSVLIGEDAGINDDLANNRNTFIGNQAGRDTSTGGNNIGIGFQALFANTTGNGSLAIGYQALLSLTSGSNNSAIGNSALTANLTGGSNTAVGSSAMVSSTAGHNNSALGLKTLWKNTTGNNNVAVGMVALQENTTAEHNVGVGYSALKINTKGQRNVAIGGFSGFDYNDTTGAATNNIFLGYNTGRGVVTGISNTILGANVTGLSSTLSNHIVLADGDGNQRIVADNNGDVGINETSPDYKLDVNGSFGFTPGTSVTPVDNGDVVIEATNNTTLTFKLKGTDGVVRSATLTLA